MAESPFRGFPSEHRDKLRERLQQEKTAQESCRATNPPSGGITIAKNRRPTLLSLLAMEGLYNPLPDKLQKTEGQQFFPFSFLPFHSRL